MIPIGWAMLGNLAANAHGTVRIDKKPLAVEHKTFDPAHPPKEMPKLDAGESAVTASQFECKVELAYAQQGRRRDADGCTASVRVQGVRAVLELRVIIWLPEHAPDKLKAHEEGHRQIAERVYKDAEKVAREAAKAIDGKTVSGTAGDCAAAERQATQDAANRFCHAYLDRTAAVSAAVGDTYDQLTRHGTKMTPDEEQAIREAFEKQAKSSPDSKSK
jgi:hypothetical protein